MKKLLIVLVLVSFPIIGEQVRIKNNPSFREARAQCPEVCGKQGMIWGWGWDWGWVSQPVGGTFGPIGFTGDGFCECNYPKKDLYFPWDKKLYGPRGASQKKCQEECLKENFNGNQLSMQPNGASWTEIDENGKKTQKLKCSCYFKPTK